VTPEQAGAVLEDFVEHRLPDFGRFQDAMWAQRDEPVLTSALRQQAFLYHSRLSAAMNLKLLDPRDVIAAAEQAYREGRAPLAAVEGFIRQILGWREYVRGIYWHFMPGYLEMNEFEASQPLPACYWTGETDLNCLRQVIRQSLEFGYAHHIQRLMVTGLFALLLGVKPRAVHEWYLAMYVDAVEWVELPNTLGMSQHADGGLMEIETLRMKPRLLFNPNDANGSTRKQPLRGWFDLLVSAALVWTCLAITMKADAASVSFRC